MSTVNDAITKLQAKQDQTAKSVESSLHMLNELAEAKLADMANRTDKRMNEAEANREIPAGLKMHENSVALCKSSAAPDQGITDALDDFLTDPASKWKDGVKKLVNTALNILLGQAAGSSHEQTYYLVMLDGHPAGKDAAGNDVEDTLVPVRIDYCLWGYDLQSAGVVDVAQFAMAYHARKSILDYEKVPSTIQMDLSLKDVGLPQDLRKELIGEIEQDRATGRPRKLPAFAASTSGQERANVHAAMAQLGYPGVARQAPVGAR